jgi:hypothetical protein
VQADDEAVTAPSSIKASSNEAAAASVTIEIDDKFI